MTLIVRCDDKQRLVAYLYGETTAEEQAAVESHLATCAACAGELSALQDVRGHLAAWNAPEAELGFRVTREPVVAVPPPERARARWSVPAWAQAAAAVLVLSVGAAIANLEIRYGADGITLRTGWSREAPPAQGAVAGTVAGAAAPTVTRIAGQDDAAWHAALADSEKRLRAEFAVARVGAPPVPVLSRTSASSDDVLQRVRALIEESERRQQHELALRVAQVSQDVESQRRADLVRIEQGMGQIEGVTGAEAARQRDLLNYLVRVSERR